MEDLKLHRFEAEIGGIEVPERLNNPFEYAPHPLAMLAAEQVKAMWVRTRNGLRNWLVARCLACWW